MLKIKCKNRKLCRIGYKPDICNIIHRDCHRGGEIIKVLDYLFGVLLLVSAAVAYSIKSSANDYAVKHGVLRIKKNERTV